MKKKIFSSVWMIILFNILNAQNLGIGTANPAFKLDVRNGSINTDSVYRIGTTTVLSTPAFGNLFVGKAAGRINTGNYNTFSGDQAGYSNTTGDFNSFFGHYSGYTNNLGSENSFFGRESGFYNTTGSQNSFFGRAAGNSNNIGNSNSFFGRYAGLVNSTGNSNSFFGQTAGQANSIGNFNSFFGQAAGNVNSSGTYNTAMGYNANVSTGTLTNTTAVGANARVDCINCIVLGSVNGINGATSSVNVGIGLNNPQHPLDINGRMRLHGTNPNDPGIWLNDAGTDRAFVGLQNNNQVGFYGTGGIGWGFTMNTSTGALSVNGNAGQPGQVLVNNADGKPAWESALPKAYHGQLIGDFNWAANNGQYEIALPGMFIQVIIVKPSMVTISVLVKSNCSGCGAQTVGFDLFRDNSKIIGLQEYDTQETKNHVLPNFSEVVSPGTYVYKVHANRVLANIPYRFYGDTYGVDSYITVQVFPQ